MTVLDESASEEKGGKFLFSFLAAAFFSRLFALVSAYVSGRKETLAAVNLSHASKRRRNKKRVTEAAMLSFLY